jgi:aspartyl/asparaginyl beta-hydroxylase (cupin superfamily)
VLCHRDRDHLDHCARCPATASLIGAIRARHGYVNQCTFLVLEPDTVLPDHIDPHNYLVSLQLPVIVPEHAGLRVGGESRPYEPGRCLAFDNSFMHRAWNHGDRRRVVLAIHTFHPDMTAIEVQAMALLHASLVASDLPM